MFSTCSLEAHLEQLLHGTGRRLGHMFKTWRSLFKAICSGYNGNVPLKHTVTFMREHQRPAGSSEETTENSSACCKILVLSSTKQSCPADAASPLGGLHGWSLWKETGQVQESGKVTESGKGGLSVRSFPVEGRSRGFAVWGLSEEHYGRLR